jgi:cholesterol oxidase
VGGRPRQNGLSKEAYGAIVIGSGFGGAVAACRLAQAGVDVALLERGARFPLGGFPRHVVDSRDSLLWHHGGPYDVRPLNDVLVVQAAGYGGGSLVYANVQMRPPATVFDGGWPSGYSRSELDPYYDLVGYMLDITPVRDDPATGHPPPKTLRMEDAAARLGRKAQHFRPNLAIRFEGGGAPPTRNKFGALQSGCIHCGECDVGCNVGAKNTLDLNYLTLAERSGIDVATRSEATWLAPREERGFEVRYTDKGSSQERTIVGSHVFLALGAINTTELLLRCRDQFGTLPNLSSKLGVGYSANGDFLAFATGSKSFHSTRGPTITTACVYDIGTGDGSWFMVEDGGYSNRIAQRMPLLHPIRLAQLAGREVEDRLLHHAHSFAQLLQEEGDSTAVLLVMGRDRADGTFELRGAQHRLHVQWNLESNLSLYATETAACREFAHALEGQLSLAPNFRLISQPSAVHNLGGCRMGIGVNDGVVDRDGRVFGYPGLHVIDAAILPGAVGVNPSHTIAAVAERCVEAAIRRMAGTERWQAPERSSAPALKVPEDSVSIPTGGSPVPASQGGGLRWREAMHGEVMIDSAIRRAGFRIAIAVPDVSAFIADPSHPGSVTGSVLIEGVTPSSGSPIEGGSFHLFVETTDPRERHMIYSLPFHATDDRKHVLSGLKHVRGNQILDFWRSTTRLKAKLEKTGEAPVSVGELELGVWDVAKLLASMRGTRGGRWSGAVVAYWRFILFYSSTILRLYIDGRKGRRG